MMQQQQVQSPKGKGKQVPLQEQMQQQQQMMQQQNEMRQQQMESPKGKGKQVPLQEQMQQQEQMMQQQNEMRQQQMKSPKGKGKQMMGQQQVQQQEQMMQQQQQMMQQQQMQRQKKCRCETCGPWTVKCVTCGNFRPELRLKDAETQTEFPEENMMHKKAGRWRKYDISSTSGVSSDEEAKQIHDVVEDYESKKEKEDENEARAPVEDKLNMVKGLDIDGNASDDGNAENASEDAEWQVDDVSAKNQRVLWMS